MTDQPKWTPGPWMVGGVRCRVAGQDTHSILRYDADKNRDETIATVWYDPKTGLGRADAHLIAAAPDMYAALEMAKLWLDVDGRFDMQGINAALAKARGQA